MPDVESFFARENFQGYGGMMNTIILNFEPSISLWRNLQRSLFLIKKLKHFHQLL
jgi:hypothetical protein